jgi:N-acetylmuramoyl-L-alanine amidase
VPALTPDTAPGTLPGIPQVNSAPLKLSVIYPARDQLITVRDSNFVLGSVGSGDATLAINGIEVPVKPNGAFLAWLPIPEGQTPSYSIMARRGGDTATLQYPVRTWRSPVAPRQPAPAHPVAAGLVALGARTNGPDTDRVISVRPVPAGTYKWFAIPGTLVERVSAENGYTRVRLDGALDAYVATSDVVELPDSVPQTPPRRVIGNIAVVPDSAWTDIVFPLRDPPLYLVDEERDKLILTLYSTRATTDIISYRRGDSLVRAVTWEPLSNERVRYVVHLRGAPFGYLVFHDGRSLILRVRKAPVINRARPLEGLTIAVDAGHPPIGSTGPTGLYEGDATLGISVALRDELERRGATVLMTRTTLGPVELGIRPIMARRANAHALISVHLNAVPDGINPLTANGTGTYFFHPQSEPLARAAQEGMVRSMGLRDLGVFYDNLALVRETWMPAILCEGAFVIVPEQEAAMRDPEGQKAYARGVAAGIEAFFRALGQSQ